MKFNIFAPTTQPTVFTSELARSRMGQDEIDGEHAALTAALHALLGGVRNSVKGGDQLQRLGDIVLAATPRLRLVWIGFCGVDEQRVLPHVVLGESIDEAGDWRLPHACFDLTAPYSQAALESLGDHNEVSSLFAPWHADLEACSAHCALAIPLRSEKTEVRGLVVFYADDVNYFSRLGIAPFQAFCHVAEMIWQQSSMMQMLAQKAQLDPLTGLMNRRKMQQVLQKSLAHAAQANELLSVVMVRIVGFDKINASHGWNVADTLLASFAHEIALQLRPQDRIGRWTGVEFLYLLPRTDVRHAEFLARGMQAYFASHPLCIDDKPVYLDLQVGMATYPKQAHDQESLLLQAGQPLKAIAAGVSSA